METKNLAVNHVTRDYARKSPRGQLLAVIACEGLLTIRDLVELTTLNAKQIRDNAGAARAEGLLTSRRDDVTGGVGFQITDTGRSWLKDRGIDPMQATDPVDLRQDSPQADAEPEISDHVETDRYPCAANLSEDTPETPAPSSEISLYFGRVALWAILDPAESLTIEGDEEHAREITRRHCIETGETAMLYRIIPICKATATVEMQDL